MKFHNNNSIVFVASVSIVLMAALGSECSRAIDIAPMTWTPRTEWINVKSPGPNFTQETVTPNAVGDGVTDDTKAIQGVLNWVSNVSGNGPNGTHPTVYFPPGTYKISSTLMVNSSRTTTATCNLIGSGLNTTIKWYGPSGGAMFWPNSSSQSRYVGFVWDGNSIAGCAVLEYSDNGSGSGFYMTGIRHENESFRNFNVPAATYLPGHTQPVGAIVSGFSDTTSSTPVGEVTILNCRFYNCTYAIYNPVEIYNFFMWVVDGCEFDNNGTGFSGNQGADFVFLNSHFQQSTVADIVNGNIVRGQRLTSSGSAQFYNGFTIGAGFQDCWVDSWTNPSCAMEFTDGGQASVTDCTFTNPPAGASSPIYTVGNTEQMQLMLSNNYAPNFPSGVGLPAGTGLIHESGQVPDIDWIPAGSMGGNITSATQTFLKSTYPADSTHIIDVTAPPYNANPLGGDGTAAIQAAINAAATANNGSIVYIPAGNYAISSTLNATGGNYIIEGDGLDSAVTWFGGNNGTIMTVSNPQNITIRNVHLACYAANGFDPTTITGLKETSSGASSVVYDNVICDASTVAPGLVLSSLAAGSKVYIPFLNSPLTVTDCGQAQIFSMRAYMGAVNVSGATLPKTGFLGLMVAEGGQNVNTSLYNFTVTDNQNLLVGPYYSEQCCNDLNLQLGAGTTPGHVAIQGLGSGPTPPSVSINVNNYAGRLFYAQQLFNADAGHTSSVLVTQTGTNPIDLILAEDFFQGPMPTFTLGSGANLIASLVACGIDGSTESTSYIALADNPDPFTIANLAGIAQGLDDFRQLGALNLAVEYGQVNPSGLVAYWKLDETANPSADSSMSGITGTWKNSPSFSSTPPGLIPYADAGCLSLNGTSQYVSMGNPTALPTGKGARTICGWAKSTTTATGLRIIASFGSASTSKAMYIGMNGTSLVGGGDSNDLTVTGFWDTNWHFIALTYDGTTAKLYADGVLKTSAAKSWNLVHNACNIGAQVNATDFWKGNLDDVRIYNRALSAAEISSLAGTPSAAGALISGVTATSTSANLEGNPAFTASNNSVVPGLSGILGASDSFGDSGFNQDASDFGNFVTYLSGANITYDLGATHKVTNLLIWNFSQEACTTSGANSVQILSSTDNVNFTTVGTYSFNQVTQDPGYGSVRAIPGNNPPYALGGSAIVPAQILPVNIPSARYIKLLILSNWGASGGYVGINEVNFLGL